MLPDITDGVWLSNKHKIHPKAVLGFFYIQANISNVVRVAPFPFRRKDGMIIYPVG